MRLRTRCPAVRRTWIVELRPQAGGQVLVCQHCPQNGSPLPLRPHARRPWLTLPGTLAAMCSRCTCARASATNAAAAGIPATVAVPPYPAAPGP